MYYVHVTIERHQLSWDTYSDPRIEYAAHDEVRDKIDKSDRIRWTLSAWSCEPFVVFVLDRDADNRPTTQVVESAMMPMTPVMECEPIG